MKQKYIVAVECKNLTEQDEVRLLDMDGTEYVNEQLFKGHLKDSIADREGKVNVIMGAIYIITYLMKNKHLSMPMKQRKPAKV